MRDETTCGCGARKDLYAKTCRRCWRERAVHAPATRSDWRVIETNGQQRRVRAADQADEGRYANG